MLVEVERFINWQRRRNAEARTWRDYHYDLKQFVAVVGDRRPGAIKFRDIDRFVIEQASCGFKPATINRRLASIASFYTFLSDEDLALFYVNIADPVQIVIVATCDPTHIAHTVPDQGPRGLP